ncbi:MAG: 30S ribosomal protein S21 [Saprospiraceae bacterium]|nr:30S ribosomal protein S21 [Saprospiraceae bacterium]MCB9324384.1 30S ribosomal protein S21 [Lewinellaceae bacterium]
MLKIERSDGETIDRMLKRYKRKHRDTKQRRELSDRKQFTKPSVLRRKEILKAAYVEKKRQEK